jgi:hypothetical protein
MKIVLCGWNPGFDKVGLTKLLRATPGFTLTSAKAATDTVLGNQSVTIEVSDSQGERIIGKLNSLGVKWTN